MAEPNFDDDRSNRFSDFRVSELLNRYFDDELSEQQASEFSTLLEINPSLRQCLIDTAIQRTLFVRILRNETAAVSMNSGSSPVRHLGIPTNNRAVIAATMLIATLFYGTFTAIVWQMSRYELSTSSSQATGDLRLPNDQFVNAVATLVRATNCRWQTTEKRPETGSRLLPGPLQLVSGIAEIEFHKGAKVTIEGPCELELASRESSFLRRGKLLAKVPKRAIGFIVNTPTAEIIDLGTEFGVEVSNGGSTDVHVLSGQVEVAQVPDKSSSTKGRTKLKAGNAVRIVADLPAAVKIPYDGDRFEEATQRQISRPAGSVSHLTGPIWLGNLLDDPRGTPLDKALETDEFRATAEIDDLGVECSLHGEDPVKRIAPGIWFDFTNLGWDDRTVHSVVANDAWCDICALDHQPAGGIRTLGKLFDMAGPKTEEGLGMHASSFITFNLAEIRDAGGLQNPDFEFVCDRAGINDDQFENPRASVHLVAILCDERGVLNVVVNGEPAKVAERNGHWLTDFKDATPLRADGRFIAFRVPIPAKAKYLTLVATSAGNGIDNDHAVWSGARLEIISSSRER